MAASQGAPPDDGVTQFFQTVERYEQVISLDLEATRTEARAATVQAEVQRWKAETHIKEALSQARISTIDLVEELLYQGIRADDLAHWQKVPSEAGVGLEKLAADLEEYSNIQALAASQQKRGEELQIEKTQLEAQVRALSQERDNAHQAITAVEDKALKEGKAAERQAMKHLDSLVSDATNYGHLKKEAAELGEWIRAAPLPVPRSTPWSDGSHCGNLETDGFGQNGGAPGRSSLPPPAPWPASAEPLADLIFQRILNLTPFLLLTFRSLV